MSLEPPLQADDKDELGTETMPPPTEADDTEQTPTPPYSKKKLYIVLALILVFALFAAGVGVFLKKYREDSEVHNKEIQQEANKQQVFHDMDEIIVNLNTEGKSVSFLKLTITLDVQGKDNMEIVLKFMPRIRDVFQIYLRELRPSDMQGSVGLYRLREELLLRVNKLIYPAQVNDILFKEVLVQ